MTPTIDLNCDLGETVDGRPTADDEALFDLITSANVACGFHAGDAESMRVSCRRAADRGVSVGAHVSYDDRAGFGRRRVDIDPAVLTGQLIEQITALQDAAARARTHVTYIKPHGALYNRIVVDHDQAEAVAQAAAITGLALLGPPGFEAERAAERRSVGYVTEAFPDRGYRPDGSLVPRDESGAVIDDPSRVADRAVRLAREGVVETHDGAVLAVAADSLCIHGDTPGSVAIATEVRARLEQAGVRLEAFG